MCSGLLRALPPLQIGVRRSLLVLATALLAGAGPAGAVSTIYFGEVVAPAGTTTPPTTFTTASNQEGLFLTALVDEETERFESFAIANHGPLNIFASGGPVTGVLSDTVDDSGSIRGTLDDAVNRGFPTSPSQFWKSTTTSDASDNLFRVDFSTGVRAFGFFATAYSTEASPNMDATSLVLYLERAGGVEVFPINHTHLERPGSVFYFGVTSDDPFLAAYLRNSSTTDPGDRIGFDDFTVATTLVPEPATLLLLSAGLLGLRALGRRRSA
jgi:hypothetical protein